MTCLRPHSNETPRRRLQTPAFSPLCCAASFLKFCPKHVLPRDGKQIFRDKNKVADVNMCHPERLPGKPCCSAMEGVVSRQLPATLGATSAAGSPSPCLSKHLGAEGEQWEQSEEGRGRGTRLRGAGRWVAPQWWGRGA